MGLNVAAMFFGQFLNPLLIAPLYTIVSASVAFQLVGGAYLIGGVLFLVAVLAGGRRARASGAATS